MRASRSVLFVRPDYHCSFFYRDALRKSGWKADIYVPHNYPVSLLYSDSDILRSPQIKSKTLGSIINKILLTMWWLGIFARYRFHIYYGRPPVLPFFENIACLQRFFGENFVFELWLAKILKIKLIFLPTGCHDFETKENFTKRKLLITSY